ncbi:MAG: hypothetical protein ACREM8_13265, partial [Vulcanimicrobiaceae bacterium]
AMPALALIFHLVDAIGGDTNDGRVSGRATALAANWVDYLELHARKMYGGSSPAERLASRIRDGAVADGETVRGIQRSQWAGLSTADDLDGAIKLLVDAGWLRIETSSNPVKGGRPSRIVRVHPELRSEGDR